MIGAKRVLEWTIAVRNDSFKFTTSPKHCISRKIHRGNIFHPRHRRRNYHPGNAAHVFPGPDMCLTHRLRTWRSTTRRLITWSFVVREVEVTDGLAGHVLGVPPIPTPLERSHALKDLEGKLLLSKSRYLIMTSSQMLTERCPCALSNATQDKG